MVGLGEKEACGFLLSKKETLPSLSPLGVIESSRRSRGKLSYFLFIDFTHIFEGLLEIHALFGNQ